MKLEDVITLFFVVVISMLLGCQCMTNRHKHKTKLKYTCGIEGGCEMSINGTYDTREQCERECHNPYLQ